MGTGPFAVPTFEALHATPHQVLALVTKPPHPARGKASAPESPTCAVARRHGTPILSPEDVNAAEAQQALRGLSPDLFVVCDYGRILTPETLSIARLGGVNLHGSLLPKYRGAAPINWAIYHGETQTGATVIQLTPKLDAGPCLEQVRVSIGPEETAADIEARLAPLGAEAVCRAIDHLAAGRAQPMPQDPSQASRAPRLKKSDGVIDWSRSAAAIRDQVRAMEPWPKTATWWLRREGKPLRLILGRVLLVDDLPTNPEIPSDIQPGTVIAADRRGIVLATGHGRVRIETLQREGRKLMTADEFLRGHELVPGERFGEPAAG
jgi:methionyl-tRNA formyltransferase